LRGSPSSAAVPTSVAEVAGGSTVWSAPALTVGRWLIGSGFTVTVTLSPAAYSESSAASRST
jgi:hypothetical protein